MDRLVIKRAHGRRATAIAIHEGKSVDEAIDKFILQDDPLCTDVKRYRQFYEITIEKNVKPPTLDDIAPYPETLYDDEITPLHTTSEVRAHAPFKQGNIVVIEKGTKGYQFAKINHVWSRPYHTQDGLRPLYIGNVYRKDGLQGTAKRIIHPGNIFRGYKNAGRLPACHLGD